MRILQINTHASGGGSAKVAQNLHEAYRKLGHEAQLLTGFDQPNPEEGIHVLCPSFPQRVANVFAYRMTSKDGAFLQSAWKKVGLPLLEQADVIHLHNAHGYYLPKQIFSRLLKGPLAWTLHDEWLMSGRCGITLGCEKHKTGCHPCPNLHFYPKTYSDKSAFDYNLRRQIITAHPHIHFITPSRDFKQHLASAGITPKNIHVQPNPVECQVSPALKPFTKKPWKLLFIANRPTLEEKGLIILLKAIANTSQPENFNLTIVGKVNTRDKKQTGPLPCTTKWLGPLHDPEQILAAYQNAHVTVVPSLQETFGLTAVEGLLYTGRVICSDLPVLRETLRNTGCFTPVGDVKSLAQALDRLSDYDHDEKLAIGQSAISEALHPQRIASQYIDILNQAATFRMNP